MAKKTSEEILEGMKKATEKATDMIGDAAAGGCRKARGKQGKEGRRPHGQESRQSRF